MAKQPFTPPKLPPQINFEKLVSSISRASASIAKLDALLSQLKNPELLSRTIVTREAVLSSQIEGTQATLSEVLEHEAKKEETDELTHFQKDYREIINYRKALEKGIRELSLRPLSENLIKELHSILLKSSRGEHSFPGEFRRKQVYIGKPGATLEEASYVPPLPPSIGELFADLERFMHSEYKDTLVQIGICHYQFEAIHPFEDGNGRIGRLLISLMLYEKKLLTYPFIYLSEFFEEHRQDYYNLLKGVSEENAWEEWLDFFLRGIEVQAKKAQEICQKILDLHLKTRQAARLMNSKYSHEFIDALFINPYFTSRSLRIFTGIKNTQTLFALIEKAKNLNLIIDGTPHKGRNKVYYFKELLDLIEK
jgi:Fic family protein